MRNLLRRRRATVADAITRKDEFPMTRVLLVLALFALLRAPAGANCLPRSQVPLTVVEALDSYTIIKQVQAGKVNWDRMMPTCSKTPVTEIGCQVTANAIIRTAERPSKGTCVANYVAAIAYGFYIRKAIGAQIRIRL
jgi:hypothetical protein